MVKEIRTTVSILELFPPVPKEIPTLSANADKRSTGVYYTPSSAADYLADWLVRHEGEHILEPSFGEGVFLRSVLASSRRRNLAQVRLTGIEIDKKAKTQVRREFPASSADLRCADFLEIDPFPVQAVIGNPPYVRLRNLTDAQRESALEIACSVMGHPMEPSGSIWMPFVLHAMRFLTERGRMALVLPYELTYVRYARPLWHALARHFGSLQVLRTHERLFPDILQDVVLLLADNYGGCTNTVGYRAFERVSDLLEDCAVVDEPIPVDDLRRGRRSFIEALLPPELRRLIRTRVAASTVPARNLVTFNIGYVSGDKDFFHPTPAQVREYQLPPSSLRPALTSTRGLKGIGLHTSALKEQKQEQADTLFMPTNASLTAGEKRYVKLGIETGVANRYKCQVRKPWHVVPGVREPDMILSVFSECPVLLINDAAYVASNSLLCGFGRGLTGREIAARWYTSLTLLQCELEVHALGGGVLVLIPGEVGKLRLSREILVQEDHLAFLDDLLKQGKTTEAYQAGDRAVLIDQLGFSGDDIELIRQGIERLTHWRTSARSSRPIQICPKTEAGY